MTTAIISREHTLTVKEYDCDGPYWNAYTVGTIDYTCCETIANDKKTGYIGTGDGDTCPNCHAEITYSRPQKG